MSKTNVQVYKTLREELQLSTRVSLEEVADIGPTIAATVIGGTIVTGVIGVGIGAITSGERSEIKGKAEEVFQSQKIAFNDFHFWIELIRLSAYHILTFHFDIKLKDT